MKKFDLKEKTSVFYLGKGIIILAIVLTTSLSFLLGFFVGKNMPPPVAEHAPVITPVAGSSEKNTPVETKVPASDQTQQIPPVQTSEVQMQSEKSEPHGAEEAQKVAEIKDAQQPQEAKQDKKPRHGEENGKTLTAQADKKLQDTPKRGKKVKYAVQVGAFKNPSEADSLKAKFAKKKYKAYILIVKPKRHEKLYKVMIGEFSSRKEAEILSAKIKKSEGLRAFVALNTQEEGIR
jgi:cell division septation protein DedD